jgi:galactokinase
MREALARTYGVAADGGAVRIVRAPGRVNLIGEHTDYNEGFVMPAAIGLETWIAFVPTDDRRVELALLATGERRGFSLDAIGPPGGTWLDYVAGTASVLADLAVPLHGLRGVVASTLPIGAGLSSSAAFELVSAWSLAGPSGPSIDRMTLARAAQRAENEYVGVRCGLMDQFACSLGVADAALLLDCRTLDYRPVPLPLMTHSLVVCHSGSPRRLDSSQYNARRAQCERAVAVIAASHPGVRALRDVTWSMLDRARRRLDKETILRCEHVLSENERVLAAEAALVAGDLPAVGRLWAESHASLRDRYEVSSPDLDALVEIATASPGVVAARMTGAGFGGCTVNLVERAALPAVREAIEHEYPARTGLIPRIWVVSPVEGAGPAIG